MIAEPLTCWEVVSLVTDYLEGALAPGDRARFEEHIAECDGCAAYLEQIRETIRLTGTVTVTAESLPAGARDAFLHAFRDWKSG